MRSRTSNKPERARSIRSKRAVALFLAAAAAFVITSAGSAEQEPDQVNVQGGWAYTAKDKDGAVEHVAATRAAEDAVWLTLGCVKRWFSLHRCHTHAGGCVIFFCSFAFE